jgi:hypothetical protein
MSAPGLQGANLALLTGRFPRCQVEDKLCWEPLHVPLHRPVEHFDLDTINGRQVGIQNHSLVPNGVDEPRNIAER